MISKIIVLIAILYIGRCNEIDQKMLQKSSNGTSNKNYRLDINFYPDSQKVNLSYLTKDQKITGTTEIYILNKQKTKINEVTLNSYNITVRKVQLKSIDGKLVQQKGFGLLPQYEKLVVTLSEDLTTDFILFVEFESRVNSFESMENRIGAYLLVDENNNKTIGLATQFQSSFARTVFPCFDEPYFRTKFKLNFTVLQDPNREFDMILGNEGEINRADIKSQPIGAEFNQTVPIPTYLVAFAVLKSSHYQVVLQFDYFDKLVRVIIPKNDLKLWKNGTFEKELKYFIPFTISYCENKFGFPWKMSSKIDILFADMVAGGIRVVINRKRK